MCALRVSGLGRTFSSGVALSEDLRGLIVDEICRLGGDRTTGFIPQGAYAFVSRKYKVASATVNKLWSRFCDEFTVSRRPTGGDYSSKLGPEDLELIEVIKQCEGTISFKEIAAILDEFGECGGNISLSAISRAVKSRMLSGKKYSRKKIIASAHQRYTVANMLYTQLFIDYLSAKEPQRLKFFDEAGIKIPDVGTRLYGHAPVGERCVDVVKKHESPNSTLNLIVSLNGPEYYDIIDGATNTLEFLDFFDKASSAVNLETRRPALQVGDIVVMDNLAVHHYEGGEIIEEFLGEMGIELLYTPTYSPDLNPVELCFNKIKTVLNYELRDMVSYNLHLAAMLAVETVTHEDMVGFFRHTSYLLQ